VCTRAHACVPTCTYQHGGRRKGEKAKINKNEKKKVSDIQNKLKNAYSNNMMKKETLANGQHEEGIYHWKTPDHYNTPYSTICLYFHSKYSSGVVPFSSLKTK
jgi:hypothetical protein